MPMFRPHTLESRRKMSISRMGNKNKLGFKLSDETKQRISNARKDKVWYNNGERIIPLRIGQEIPKGFVKGIVRTEEERARRSARCRARNLKRWALWRAKHGQSTFREFDN